MDNIHCRFNTVLKTLTDRDHLLAKVAYEAAPTIAGIKPSSLVTFCRHERNLYDTWVKRKSEISRVLGCCYCELKKNGNYILVLFYNPGLLTGIVATADSQALLRALGYKAGVTLGQMLPTLKMKLKSDDFPHELGLLLGIPKCDIVEFIEKKGAGCLFCGYWKVYNNPDQARRLFRQYDAAKLRVLHGVCRLYGQTDAPAS